MECFLLSSLVDRVGPDELAGLTQPDFEMVLAPQGPAHHEVDFVVAELGPRCWLHVRPGQVQRWILEPRYEAVVFLCPRLRARADWSPGPSIIELSEGRSRDLEPLLRVGLAERRSQPLSAEALDALLRLLVAELELDRPADPKLDPMYLEFRRAIDRDQHAIRSVDHYASALGCSSRTLARACHAAIGVSPKRILDDETALAAQRLLRLPGATVTAVAAELGFAETTNFTKFFKRTTGETPSAWVARADRA